MDVSIRARGVIAPTMSSGVRTARLGLAAGLLACASLAAAQSPGLPPPGAVPPGAPPLGAPPGSPSGPPGPPPAAGDEGISVPEGMPFLGFPIELPPLAPDAQKSSADPHDLEGTWFHDQSLVSRIQTDMYGNRAPFNAQGAKVLTRRVEATKKGLPFVNASALCRPPGQQWQLDLNFPFQIYQSKDEIDFVFEEYHGVWKIMMDPQRGIAGPKEYMGRSVGHWDGDTLVVDTTDFRQPLWLDVDGTPASASAHLIHRIRKVGKDHPFLEIVTTIDDPKSYKRSWSNVRTFAWRPDKLMFAEYNCEEQVGDKDNVAQYGLVPEPTE